MLSIPDNPKIQLKEEDIIWRYVKASSKGGQHANKTESGCIATHAPTGITIKCINERSQHQNKEFARMYLLAALNDQQACSSTQAINSCRQDQIGTGDRAHKIRTIRFEDNIVKNEITGATKNLKLYLKGDLSF